MFPILIYENKKVNITYLWSIFGYFYLFMYCDVTELLWWPIYLFTNSENTARSEWKGQQNYRHDVDGADDPHELCIATGKWQSCGWKGIVHTFLIKVKRLTVNVSRTNFTDCLSTITIIQRGCGGSSRWTRPNISKKTCYVTL